MRQPGAAIDAGMREEKLGVAQNPEQRMKKQNLEEEKLSVMGALNRRMKQMLRGGKSVG
jgi:hypothetical protein